MFDKNDEKSIRLFKLIAYGGIEIREIFMSGFVEFFKRKMFE